MRADQHADGYITVTIYDDADHLAPFIARSIHPSDTETALDFWGDHIMEANDD